MENKYRTFSERDIQRLKLIKKARTLEISLHEIKNITSACISKGCGNARQYVASQLPQYITAINEKLEILQRLKAQLVQLQSTYENTVEWKHKTNSCCEILKMDEKV